MSSNRLFGTDGIRGMANVYPMSPELILKLGQVIGVYFKDRYPHPRILIGKDTRLSGYMLEQALASGICSVGVDVAFLGPLPTPGIAYLTRGMRACAGIVLSASHNPFHDNGIKIFSANGYKLPDEEEDKLEAMLTQSDISSHLLTRDGIGRARRIDDAIGQYAVFLKEQFPKHLTLEGLRIVLDCANGASYKVAPKVFSELGAEVFLIGVEPNGTNINKECGALYPARLKEQVQLYKADIGLAFDGDADRIVVVDSKGQIVDGDQILAICGTTMIKKGTLKNNTVVSTVLSNMGLDIAMNSMGGKVVRTKVGDRYVMEEMVRGGYNLGGEQSGHLIFRDSSTTGDGLLAALKLLEIIIEEGKNISDLKQCMDALPQKMINIEVQKKIPVREMPKFEKVLSKYEKELDGKGRVLFRYSGTESLARIMVEGTDENKIENILDDIVDQLKKNLAQYQQDTIA